MKGRQLETAGAMATKPDLYPLDRFYSSRGQTLPNIEWLPAKNLLEPYRSLLVHDGDMTSKLEEFHKKKIAVRVLARDRQQGIYFREVALQIENRELAVEYGAIAVALDLFSPEAQQEILGETKPLGTILKEFGMAFHSEPRGYFRLKSDPPIWKAIGADINALGGPEIMEWFILHGRRNTIVDEWSRPLAQIVEMLQVEFS